MPTNRRPSASPKAATWRQLSPHAWEGELGGVKLGATYNTNTWAWVSGARSGVTTSAEDAKLLAESVAREALAAQPAQPVALAGGGLSQGALTTGNARDLLDAGKLVGPAGLPPKEG